MLADLVAIVLGLAVAFAVQEIWRPVDEAAALGQWLVVVASLPLRPFSANVNHLYTARANVRIADEFRHLVASTALGVAAVVSLVVLAGTETFSRWMTLVIFFSVLPIWFLVRQVVRAVFAKAPAVPATLPSDPGGRYRQLRRGSRRRPPGSAESGLHRGGVRRRHVPG